MPVFISHRTKDNALAQKVAKRLHDYHNIPVYIDEIDGDVNKAQRTAAITALLVDRINRCTNLLAVVTQNTQGSWWVPFEIGVARQAPRVITCLTDQEDASLPEYLFEWPRLRGETAVDTFARLYKAQSKILNERVLGKRATAALQFSSVTEFEKTLKIALGQR